MSELTNETLRAIAHGNATLGIKNVCPMAEELLALRHAREAGDDEKHLLRRVLGVIITVRRKNTHDWMEYIAEVVNEMNAAIGEADRVEIHGDGIRIVRLIGKGG